MRVASLLLAFSVMLAPAVGLAGDWKAGVASQVITPEKLMWMSGYGSRNKPAEGKLTDLYAKAMILEDGTGNRLALITLDLVGIDRELALDLREKIRKQTGLRDDQIAINTSHTHCGPVVRGNLAVMYAFGTDSSQLALVDEYADLLLQRVPAVVDAAIKDLAPSQVSWGTGRAGFAVNRRNNTEKDVPAVRARGELKGPVDHSVPVLAIHRDGKLHGVAFGYACHATVLSFYQWCGDYPGFAQTALEERYPGAVALFWAGCGADQNPLPRREVAQAQEYGQRLANAVNEVLVSPMTSIEGKTSSAQAEIDLPFAKVPPREEVEKLAAGAVGPETSRAKLMLQRWSNDWPSEAKYPYPVQTWKLGNGPVWTFLGGEVVVDYSNRIKTELGGHYYWVAGYSNDVMAYIPSERVLKEGGYEGATSMLYYAHPSPWATGLEDKIVGEAVKQARSLTAGK